MWGHHVYKTLKYRDFVIFCGDNQNSKEHIYTSFKTEKACMNWITKNSYVVTPNFCVEKLTEENKESSIYFGTKEECTNLINGTKDWHIWFDKRDWYICHHAIPKDAKIEYSGPRDDCVKISKLMNIAYAKGFWENLY